MFKRNKKDGGKTTTGRIRYQNLKLAQKVI